MSLTKAKDLRNLSDAELSEKKKTLEKDLYELNLKKVTGQLDKPHQFHLIRRQIAQINTLQREKQNV